MSTNEWATLIVIFNRLEAEILKEALLAQGIPVELFQEGLSHFLYPVSGPLGKIELCVPSDRLPQALNWLEEYNKGLLENDNPDDAIIETKQSDN